LQSLFPIRLLPAEDRRLLTIVGVIGVLHGYSQSHLSALVPFTRVALEVGEAGMSTILSITRLVSLGAVVFSLWGDRTGRRRPFLAAIVLLMVATTLTAVTRTAVEFTVLQSVSRVASAAVGTLGAVLVAESITPRFRAFGIGVFAAAASFGAGAGQLMLLVADNDLQAWRIPFALAGLGLLALPWIRRLPESPLAVEQRHVPVAILLRGGLAHRFWISGLAALLAAALPAVSIAFVNERLINRLGLATGTAVTIGLLGGTVGGLGFWIGGRMADVWGRRTATVAALCAAAIGGVWLYSVTSLGQIAAAIALGSFGSFAYLPAAAAHRAELFPNENRTTAAAMGTYLATLGSALALFTGGITIDRMGLSATIYLMAIPTAAAVWLTLLLPETKDQPLSGLAA
jgi:SHS family lactate transporter-like MFS transporter